MIFCDVMRLLPTSNLCILTKDILQLLIIACSAVIITSSVMLFITDRGNIITYANEQFHDWKNPSYEEMETFLSKDKTDLHVFIPGTYECKQFCFDLIRNARNNGIRAGYVTLTNPVGDDHAIVCFQTTDEGYVFVEPQLDVQIPASEMKTMLETGYYTMDVEGLTQQAAMPLDNVHISWYMVI